MQLIVEIPDDLVGPLNGSSGDLARRALESFALGEYKSGNLTEDGLRRMLGFGTRYRLDGFLKAHGVFVNYSLEDFHREIESLQGLDL